jgi:hypothetical protein
MRPSRKGKICTAARPLSTAIPSTSTSPTRFFSTACRSASRRIANSRFR